MQTLNTGNSNKLRSLGHNNGDREEEKRLHKKFSYLHKNLEWFHADDDIIEYINQEVSDLFHVMWSSEEKNDIVLLRKMAL